MSFVTLIQPVGKVVDHDLATNKLIYGSLSERKVCVHVSQIAAFEDKATGGTKLYSPLFAAKEDDGRVPTGDGYILLPTINYEKARHLLGQVSDSRHSGDFENICQRVPKTALSNNAQALFSKASRAPK